MQYFIGSSGTAESFVTVEPLHNELSRDRKNMFAMTRFGNIQVISVYSRTFFQGTPSEPYKMYFFSILPSNQLWSIFQAVK